jgi:selenocysteine lyase/cysteine desulfurase
MDVTALRADTPGCARRVHLNNAGASLMPAPVLEAVQTHLKLEAEIGGYEAAADAAPAIEQAYAAVADLLGTQPHNVAFTEHATAAFVQALSSIPFERGDALVTTRSDYASNQIQYLSLASRLGIEVLRAPDAPEGGVDLQAMEEIIHRRRPRVVAVTHVPTNSGLVQDVAAVGHMCRARDILYLVDACQSVGQMPVHPEAMGCDFLSVTARKFLRGPRGAGCLWVSDRVLEAGFQPLFPDLRGADWIDGDLFQPAPDARRFETWEFAWALVLGTGAASRYASNVGLPEIEERVRSLMGHLRGRLAALDGVTVLDRGARLAGIVTVSVEGRTPRELVSSLRERGINTSSQTRFDAVLDYDAKGVDGALRLSPHYFNTMEELDLTVDALREIGPG